MVVIFRASFLYFYKSGLILLEGVIYVKNHFKFSNPPCELPDEITK